MSSLWQYILTVINPYRKVQAKGYCNYLANFYLSICPSEPSYVKWWESLERKYAFNVYAASGVSKGRLRVLEHPPEPAMNLLASKIRSLNSSFLSLATWPKQPSLTVSYLQERVGEGCGQRFGGVA